MYLFDHSLLCRDTAIKNNRTKRGFSIAELQIAKKELNKVKELNKANPPSGSNKRKASTLMDMLANSEAFKKVRSANGMDE